MITRGLIKKTLTAGMLALLACTSMSAMAKEQWVFAGDYFNEPNIRIYEDENICKFWAEHFDRSWGSSAGQDKITFTGEVEDYFYAGEPRKWCHMENHPNGGFSFGPQCDRGTYSHSRPDGCYEFKEPNPVPPIEPNDPTCDGKDRGHEAGVACDTTGKRYSCVWEMNSYFTDDEARARYHYCVKRHEQTHIDNKDLVGSYCTRGGRGKTDPPNLYWTEYLSYQDSVQCFTEQKDLCNTKACADQMDAALRSSIGYRDSSREDYKKECESNCVNLE